jgi:hypothetical protein
MQSTLFFLSPHVTAMRDEEWVVGGQLNRNPWLTSRNIITRRESHENLLSMVQRIFVQADTLGSPGSRHFSEHSVIRGSRSIFVSISMRFRRMLMLLKESWDGKRHKRYVLYQAISYQRHLSRTLVCCCHNRVLHFTTYGHPNTSIEFKREYALVVSADKLRFQLICFKSTD